MYRRLPDRYRRYVSSQNTAEASSYTQAEAVNDNAKAAVIPLPNEEEPPSDPTYESKRLKPKSGLQGFFQRIQIDDLILVGLIILLLDEGLDSMEDDFLLVILLYLLLIGRN